MAGPGHVGGGGGAAGRRRGVVGELIPAGGSLTIAMDGATIGTVTAATSPAPGYLGIGSSSQASPQVEISQVSFG